jgi:hypothetical protein
MKKKNYKLHFLKDQVNGTLQHLKIAECDKSSNAIAIKECYIAKTA